MRSLPEAAGRSGLSLGHGGSGSGNALPTGYTFTGQLDTGVGLMYYGARLYDAALARFIQPDTIVPEPGNPQALNRYSYVLNNPIKYRDPSGHAQVCADGDEGGGCGYGANTAQIWQTFAGKNSVLVEYYATLHRLILAQASGASAVEVEALAGAVDSAYSAGSVWLPQHQFDPTVVIEPASLVSMGGAITGGGMRALGSVVRAVQQSLGSSAYQYGGHATVNQEMARVNRSVNSHKTVGFTVIYQGEAGLEVRWNSGSVNRPNWGANAAPMEYRQPIIDALQAWSGLKVTGQ